MLELGTPVIARDGVGIVRIGYEGVFNKQLWCSPPNSLIIVLREIVLNEGVVGFFTFNKEESSLGHIHKNGGIADIGADIDNVYKAHFLRNVAGDFVKLHIVGGVELLVEKNRVRKWHL